MKGRKVPPRPEVAEIVRKAEPLTMADIEAMLAMYRRETCYHPLVTVLPSERMPEPTPYERGFPDRFQDRKSRP